MGFDKEYTHYIMLYFLTKGFIIGFLLAIPVGPTVLLCIRHSLLYGMRRGLSTGLGAALADAVYGVLAGYGIYALTEILNKYYFALHVLGSLLLLYLGAKTYFAHSSINQKKLDKVKPSYTNLFMQTFTITATSPLTLVGVTALCAAVGLNLEERVASTPWILSLGIFLGSAAWWIILSFIMTLFKSKMTQNGSKWLNRLSGIMLFGLGLFVLYCSF